MIPRIRHVISVGVMSFAFAGQAHGAQAAGARVTGIVRDSIARAPIPGATVQLVTADARARVGRIVRSDSLGKFTLDSIPDGRYALGFFHPILDSLGLAAPVRELSVDKQRPVQIDLAIPSARRLRETVCGSRSLRDSSALLVGIVRDARTGAPAADVTVAGAWVELSLTRSGYVRHDPRALTKTGENGWFAICGVPTSGEMTLSATHGRDSSDLVRVPIPPGGFIRRELYLGHEQSLADGQLSGTVVTTADGTPIAGAQVSIVGGPQTRANDRGEWTLAAVQPGTRMLRARAVGFYPELRAVDVVAGALPVRIALSTVKTVLDTMKVLATRFDNGFRGRLRSGAGSYLTQEDIARRNPLSAVDIFRMVSGVHTVGGDMSDTRLLVRGIRSPWCDALIFLDGLPMAGASAEDIDVWVRPEKIKGIEVYSGTSVPVQYRGASVDCGSILIWTR